MAQTRRKRRSKHRGTPAGTIEARGRTGRKPRPEERRDSRPARANRFDRPPTWRGALTRAAIAAALFFVVVVLALGQPVASSISVSFLMLAVYIPLGYYTDMWLYRRRRRKLEARRQEGR